MSDDESLDLRMRRKMAKSFKLNKADSEFLLFHYKHCSILSESFKAKNSKPKGSPILCCECNQEIPVCDLVCYNRDTFRNKHIFCKSCWGKKYLDTGD